MKIDLISKEVIDNKYLITMQDFSFDVNIKLSYFYVG